MVCEILQNDPQQFVARVRWFPRPIAIAGALIAAVPDLIGAYALAEIEPIASILLLLSWPILVLVFLTGAYHVRFDSRDVTSWSTPLSFATRRSMPLADIAQIGVQKVYQKGVRYALSITARDGSRTKILDGMSTQAQAGAEAITILEWVGRYRGVAPRLESEQ